jgi:hypothetical protein
VVAEPLDVAGMVVETPLSASAVAVARLIASARVVLTGECIAMFIM